MHDRLSRCMFPAIVVGAILLILLITIAWDRQAREAAPTPEHHTSPFFLPFGAY